MLDIFINSIVLCWGEMVEFLLIDEMVDSLLWEILVVFFKDGVKYN